MGTTKLDRNKPNIAY